MDCPAASYEVLDANAEYIKNYREGYRKIQIAVHYQIDPVNRT